jgi:hypothetical protein
VEKLQECIIFGDRSAKKGFVMSFRVAIARRVAFGLLLPMK